MPRRGLYPRTAPRLTESHAEGRLYAALARGLPEGWVAWHSLRIRTDEGQEAEADFVVAVPDRGAIVIEVKGGRVEVRDGTWLQNGRAMDPLPRAQGHRIRRALLATLEKVHGGFLPGIVVATAFPDTAFAREPDQGDVRGAVLGEHDLPHLAQALPALAERLFVPPRPPRDAAWIDALHRLWGETWTPRLSLGSRIRLREDELVQLDREQVAVLDMIDRNPRLLVQGGPGTGKTLLAREICRRLR